MNTAPSNTAVVDLQDKTHADIKAQLQILRGHIQAIETDSLDVHAREQVRKAIHYFNTEARQHHLDEEKHIFPVLLASPDEKTVHTTQRLIQDHGWLEENWIQIAPSLDAAAHGNMWFDPQELHHALDVFEALYLEHIKLEESMVLPQAKKRLDAHSAAGEDHEAAPRRSKRQHPPEG
jgi:hemerythrin-like domain-containing protein